MFNSAFWWAMVGIGLMLCEFVVPGLILFFLGIGALITALLVWLLPISLTVQLAVFAVASLAALFGLRRLMKPIFTGRATDVNETDFSEGMAGQEAKVTEAIAPDASGRVMLNGTTWKAESDEALSAGQVVVVVGQKSLTLIVKGK
ncbi:NfeD family protein [Pontiellaceae bacterium B12219]|nr:NfeD family protein [Pontiellaceae bacterium B12219]